MTKLMTSNEIPQLHPNLGEHTKRVVIERFDLDGVDTFEDYVIKEQRVKFFLNGVKFLSVMCIAKYQDAHIVGFLLSEAVIKSLDDVKSLEVSDDGLSVYIDADVSQEGHDNLFKEKTLTSGCCIGVTGNAEELFKCSFVSTDYTISAEEALKTMRSFSKPSELFDNTGCVHKARLVLEDGSFFEAEDIGRHNAIDKVVGLASLSKKDIQRSVLYASGRLSMEMVVKCVMHKIPIVISKAAVTFQGIKAANEHGITLVGFARANKMNLYTHSARIGV